MNETLRRLTERFKEIAIRYGQVTGEAPPPMEATADRLTAAIAAMQTKMAAVRYGTRTDRTVVGVGAVRLVIDPDDDVRATVDGVDAEGGVVTFVDVRLGGRELHGEPAVRLQQKAREMAGPLLGLS